MKHKIIPIIMASLALGISFDILFYNKALGISALLYGMGILGITFYLDERFRSKPNSSIWLITPLIIFFTAMIAVRSSSLLVTLNTIASVYLLLLLVQLMMDRQLRLNHLTSRHYRYVVRLPFMFMTKFVQLLPLFIGSRSDISARRPVNGVVRGILLSIPILAIFLLLLSSADSVFQHYVTSIFNFDIQLNDELVFRTGLMLFVASLFIGAYGLIFLHTKQDDLMHAKWRGMALSSIESSVILGSVGVLFFLFVLIQARYFFGGASAIDAMGTTYATYARDGFFELILVAVGSLALILTLSKITVRRNITQIMTFTGLSSLLTVEVMVIMASAFQRLSLYEEAYGFTVLRLFSHLFIGWLAVVFVLLLVHLIRHESEQQFVFRVFVSVMAFLALLNCINPDAMIAKQNIDRYYTTGKLDLNYLTEGLSEDATPTISTLLYTEDKTLKNATAHGLYLRQQQNDDLSGHWQSFNLSRDRAQKILNNNSLLLKNNAEYKPSRFTE